MPTSNETIIAHADYLSIPGVPISLTSVRARRLQMLLRELATERSTQIRAKDPEGFDIDLNVLLDAIVDQIEKCEDPHNEDYIIIPRKMLLDVRSVLVHIENTRLETVGTEETT